MTTASSAVSHQVAGGQPGRLGRPELDLGTDPRSDPRMIAALAPFGLDKEGGPPPLGPDSPREALLEFAAAAEAGFEAVSAFFVGVGNDGHARNFFVFGRANRQRIDVDGQAPRE